MKTSVQSFMVNIGWLSGFIRESHQNRKMQLAITRTPLTRGQKIGVRERGSKVDRGGHTQTLGGGCQGGRVATNGGNSA